MSLNSADGPFDLFVIAGQSNAEGRGNSASSPALTGLAYLYNGSSIVALADPVGGASTGSAWPAFANAWTAATGRVPVFVEQGTGSSALLAAAESTGGNWSTTGALFDACVTAANAAKAEIGADLGNTYILWAQGERDAEAINGTTVTAALYKTALMELADRFYASLSIDRMFIFITGAKTNELYYNFSAIRQAQRDACRSNGRLVSVFDRAQYFPAESKMSDTVHYSQAGYNEMGDTGGDNAALVFAGQNITPASPYNNVVTRMVTESYLRLNTSQHAQVVIDPAITPATDFTIAVKFKWLAGTGNPYLLTLGRMGAGYDDFAIIFGDTAKSIDFYRVRNGTVDGTLVNYFTAGNPYQDGETHIAILKVDGLNLKAWIDTDEGQTFTGASAQTYGVNILTLNARWAGSVSRQSDSQFYYAYIYDVLSDADITALMAGASPESVGTIRKGYPLNGNGDEVNGGTALTLTGSPEFFVQSFQSPLIGSLLGSLISNLIN